MSSQFISLLERGRRSPSKKLVARCAEFFEDDPNYVAFLALSMPVDLKRALAESPAAPDYIPRAQRAAVHQEDAEDQLIQALLLCNGLRHPSEDTPFHFAEEPNIDASAAELPLNIADQINRFSELFSPRSRAWATFFRAYYARAFHGREAAAARFEEAERQLAQETAAAYPAKLHYLVALHIGLAAMEAQDATLASDQLQRAIQHGSAMNDAAAQAVARWLFAARKRAEGDVLTELETLRAALAADDVPAFGVARCLTSLIQVCLNVEDYETVLDSAEPAARLWRSATLDAPQLDKSLHLLRVELAALEANVAVGNRDDAEAWLNRARTLHSRIDTAPSDDARLTAAIASLMRLRGNVSLARRRFREALEHEGATDRTRLNARLALAAIAVEEDRHEDAEDLLEGCPRPISTVERLTRDAQIALTRYGSLRLQDKESEARDALSAARQAIRTAIEEDARVEQTPLAVELIRRVNELEQSS